MDLHGVHFPEGEIAELCRKHGASRLSLFGSILRDDFGPASDVDVLVEYPASAEISLFELAELMIELEKLLGRRVDLKTAGFLSPYFRDRVVQEARPIYDTSRTGRAA